jgi:hypothetical protein
MKKYILNQTGYISKGHKICWTKNDPESGKYKEIEITLENSFDLFDINETPLKVKVTVEVLKEYPKITCYTLTKKCKREWFLFKNN